MAGHQAEMEVHAANVRRAVIDLLGAPPETGDLPAAGQFAFDVGMLRAITDMYWADLNAEALILAETSRREAAALLARSRP